MENEFQAIRYTITSMRIFHWGLILLAALVVLEDIFWHAKVPESLYHPTLLLILGANAYLNKSLGKNVLQVLENLSNKK